MTIVIAVCAVVGAIAGIAGSAAAPSTSTQAAKKAQAAKQIRAQKWMARMKARQLKRAFRGGPGGPGFRGGPRFRVGPGFGFGPVHAMAVIPKPDGTGFDTITTDAGTLLSVEGTTVHLKEGTTKATYKDDMPIDVGSDAKVIRNHQDAKLTDLKAGDHVRVITGAPKGNIVIAEDDAFLAQQKKRWERHGFRHQVVPAPPGGPGYPGDEPGPSNQNGSSSGSSGSGSNS